MMREIKFRVYRVMGDSSKKFFGYERINESGNFTHQMNGSQHWYLDAIFIAGATFHREQYTGLKDKNGHEIYEGDIIVVPDTYVFYDEGVLSYVGVVEMVFGCWAYVLQCVNPNKAGISSGDWEMIDSDGEGGARFKIIGNIHENPDLLES